MAPKKSKSDAQSIGAKVRFPTSTILMLLR
jgi:hypothetical protein